MDAIFVVVGLLFLASMVSGVAFLIAMAVSVQRRKKIAKCVKGFMVSLLCFIVSCIIGVTLGVVVLGNPIVVNIETVGWIACGLALVATFVIPIVYESRKSPEQRQKEEEKRAEIREQIASGNRIEEVKLLPGGSTVFRMGIVGQQLQRFAIKYADGHIVIKEVHPDTWEYKRLMKYVKWEDIQ